MMGIWLLLMVVLINSYTGVLTSRMTVPKLDSIPQSLEELAARREYKVTVMKESFLAKAFLVIFFYPKIICVGFDTWYLILKINYRVPHQDRLKV